MPLNEQKGNMYGFVTHTWNVLKGKCSHDCVYCYMKAWGNLRDLRFDKSELNTDLGVGNFIFVGSSTDMFADDVPDEWIEEVLAHCRNFPRSRYLFQSKNPKRFRDFFGQYPEVAIFGTTIESNRPHKVSKAPEPMERMAEISLISRTHQTMVTIEPILDFDLEPLVDMIRTISPKWVNIGADSKRHGLDEPDAEKIRQLITRLEAFTEVKRKGNLIRLLLKEEKR